MGNKPTIKDVARQAGISIATVSRIVNGLGGYGADTERNVKKVIEELGYKPNALARSLILKRTNSIGILFPTLNSRVSTELLRGVERKAHDLGMTVLFGDTDFRGERTLEYLRVLRERRVDGLIIAHERILPAFVPELVSLDIPIVLVSTLCAEAELPYIKVDDYAASFDAVSYLLDRGHRNIAILGTNWDDPISGAPRIKGYRDALHARGIAVDDALFVPGEFDFESGVDGMLALMDRRVSVSAVFCASDEVALGVISAAARRGLRVPDDLSVVGYDNTKNAMMSVPALTTVHQPLFEMGGLAVETLLAAEIERPGATILPHRIVERESVRSLEEPGK